MHMLKAGLRLKSAVCDAQVMVIKGLSGEHDLSCGGTSMIDMSAEADGILDPARADGTLLGKRYVSPDEMLELLCIKEGLGSLCLDGVRLDAKQAKALPSSD